MFAAAGDVTWQQLVAGGVGGLVVALFTARYRRSEQLRDRMMEAADEFSVSVQRGMNHLVAIGRETEANGVRSREKELESLVDDIGTKRARIVLLYGPHSTAADASLKCEGFLNAAGPAVLDDYAQLLSNGAPEKAIEKQQFEIGDWRASVDEEHDRFTRAAWRSMQAPGRFRLLQRPARFLIDTLDHHVVHRRRRREAKEEMEEMEREAE